MATGLLLKLGDVWGVMDGFVEGEVPLDFISSRKTLDRELNPDDELERDCEELDRLGVRMLGAGVVDSLGTEKDRGVLRAALGRGAADDVPDRRVGVECISCRSADELLLLRDGMLGRAEEGVDRLGVWILGVDLTDDRDVEGGRGAEKDLIAADDELARDADPPLERA